MINLHLSIPQTGDFLLLRLSNRWNSLRLDSRKLKTLDIVYLTIVLSRPEHTWISYTTDVLGGFAATNTVYVQKPLKEVVFPKVPIQQPRQGPEGCGPLGPLAMATVSLGCLRMCHHHQSDLEFKQSELLE